MAVPTTPTPGEPIWVDLASPDPTASAAFYGALLGWTATEPRADFGGYANFELDGHKVAGVLPLMEEGQPPAWTCYIATDDLDKTAALVDGAGGTALAPPMPVGDLGRMAVFADPAGAVIAAWQPGEHRGFEVTGQDGAQVWLELTAAAPSRAAEFYGTVFGWQAVTSEHYLEFTLGGTSVAGCTDPSQGTTGWVPYFAVSDPAAVTEQAVALGASVVLPLTTFDGGSCTIVRDPHGATLGLLRQG